MDTLRFYWSKQLTVSAEDGKEMNLDLEKYKIRDLQEEVDRHSRMLGRQEELSG